ncbi:uncharacterized protein LOC121758688 [Salvia splendens]|uniref:uncharacterized protein LOC121758688 n=1 Tax=Salvia splendens TaxID=180675 RepID=UPI001C270FAE|nr:uncharacterized protein LOC121758688 [Salvia splendens]
MVLLKLQPYRQHLVARPLSAKLARRYYGPFEVIERIGQVAYRLRLPEGIIIHNVFHVSLLRPFVVGDSEGPQGDLPSDFFGNRPVVYPVRVLERRLLWNGDQPREHALVRWLDGTESPTWEPLDVLHQKFPNILLEDKDVAMERGVDTIPTEPQARQEPIVEQRRKSDEDKGTKGVREEASIAKSKPTRNAKPPSRFGNFVAK